MPTTNQLQKQRSEERNNNRVDDTIWSFDIVKDREREGRRPDIEREDALPFENLEIKKKYKLLLSSQPHDSLKNAAEFFAKTIRNIYLQNYSKYSL